MAITIPILTDFNSRGIDRAIKKFGQLETKGQKAAFAVRKAALPAGLALLALGAFAAKGVAGVMEDDKALTNLESTIKSTGGAAKITGKEFFAYANELQALTGVGADEITQGAALLATFTKIRNEVGKGNDVFNRTTVAALDLSKKGFGSIESANKMLGKALQDPIKGITALGRAGVTFTDAQKQQIKVMTESGNVLGAQKMILKEVEMQVGGTAKAFGETMAGKVERSKRAFEEMQKGLAQALMPALESLVGIVTALSVFLQGNEKVVKIAIIAFAGLAAAILVVNAAMKVVATIGLLTNPVGLIIAAVALLTVGVILLYQRSETFRDVVKTSWEVVQVAVTKVVEYFKGPVMAAWDIISGAIQTISALVKGDFSGAWQGLKKTMGGVFEWIKTTILALPLMLAGAAKDIGIAIFNGIKNGLLGLGAHLKSAVLAPVRFIANKITGNWPNLPGLPGPPEFLKSLSVVGLATGGIVTRPTLALIGEAGPEAVIPLSGRNAPGGMGGITITVNAGLVSTPDQIGQQIIEAIQKAQRRSGPVFAAA